MCLGSAACGSHMWFSGCHTLYGGITRARQPPGVPVRRLQCKFQASTRFAVIEITCTIYTCDEYRVHTYYIVFLYTQLWNLFCISYNIMWFGFATIKIICILLVCSCSCDHRLFILMYVFSYIYTYCRHIYIHGLHNHSHSCGLNVSLGNGN